MHVSPEQQYQYLLAAVEEAQRLAIKFGLKTGLCPLDVLQQSLHMTTEPHGLAHLLQQLVETGSAHKGKNTTESLFQKAYDEKLTEFAAALRAVFVIEIDADKLKKILKSGHKESKKLSAQEEPVRLMQMKAHLREVIKEEFGVSHHRIRDARAILHTLLNPVTSENHTEVQDTVSRLTKLFPILAKAHGPKNQNYNGITVNGLYKFIKIANTIHHPLLTEACVDFFTQDRPENRTIINAFFAAETTSNYCRSTTLLTNTLAALVRNHPQCQRMSESFVAIIAMQPTKSAVDSILALPADHELKAAVRELMVQGLNLAVEFEPILAVAREDMAHRTQKIAQLQTSQDALLKSVFYFCFISPLLEVMATTLQRHWPSADCQALRLELSMAFDLMLGLKAPESFTKIKQEGEIASTLGDMALDSHLQARVASLFMRAEKSEPLREKSMEDRETDARPSGQRRRSHTLGNIGYFAATTNRTITFHGATPETPSVVGTRKHSLPGVAKKQLPTLPRLQCNTAPKKDSLESFFNDLFSNDSEKTTQFILALVRNSSPAQLCWGVQVLNQACGKTNKQIAEVLLKHLSDTELATVFEVLFKEEQEENWCRGNTLLAILIQQFLAQPERKEFKETIWKHIASLAEPMSNIKLQQRKSMPMMLEGFTGEPTDFTVLQTRFSESLQQILAPADFPPLMQTILQLAYADLRRRAPSDSETAPVMRKWLGFLLLRFLNPIIMEAASAHLHDDTLKMWYCNLLMPAIQTLASPLVTGQPSDNRSLQGMVFTPITKNADYRRVLFERFQTELCLVEKVVETVDAQPQPILDIPQCIQDLSEILKREEFSGLKFKPDGSVTTPRKKEVKQHVLVFFEPSPGKDSDCSGSETKSGSQLHC
ncbi:MAG: hypothetical protein JJT82_08425 [Legionellaceae bacterium]|nr:hypothetical protein [Legionellaceae bacterium]